MSEDLPPSLRQAADDLPPSLRTAEADLPPSLAKQNDDLPPSLRSSTSGLLQDAAASAIKLNPFSMAGDAIANLTGRGVAAGVQKARELAPYAEATWGYTPQGYLSGKINQKLTPAIQNAKQSVRNALEWYGAIPSDEDIEQGGASKAGIAARVGADVALDQIPESTYGIGGALLAPKLIEPLAEIGPKIDLAEGLKALSKKGAPLLEKFLGNRTSSAAGTAKAAISDLPTIAEQAKTGAPHAVYTHEWKLSEDMPGTPYFRVYGDPDTLSQMGHAWKTDLPLETIQEKGIPIIGKGPGVQNVPEEVLNALRTPARPTAGEAPNPLGILASETGSLGPGPTAPGEESAADRFTRNILDRFNPIRKPPEGAAAPSFADAGGATSQSYQQARTLTGRVYGIGREMMQDVNKLLEPLKSYEDRNVLNTIYSMRNYAELDALGKTTSGVTAEQANRVLSDLRAAIGEERFSRINGVADALANYQNTKGLDMLVKSGLVDEQQAKDLVARYPTYLRSQIIGDAVEQKMGPGALGKNATPFLKTKEGTSKQISEDVLPVIRESLMEKVAASEKQKVIDQIANEFGKTIGQYEPAQTASGRTMMVRVIDKKAKIPEGWVESSVRTSDGRIVAVRKDVEQMLQGMNKFQMDVVTKAMSSYNHVFREGATSLRLAFSAGHFARSLESAVMNRRVVPGQQGYAGKMAEAVWGVVKDITGLDKAFGPDVDLADMRRAGGFFGGLADRAGSEVPIPFRLRSPSRKAVDVAGNAVTLPLKAFNRLGKASDMVTRLAEWKRLGGTGMPDALRALNARDVSIDFEKSGDLMKVFNQWVPFLNDKVQANVNSARAFRDQPGMYAARLAGYVIAPTMGLYEWNHRFDNDSLITPDIKDHYFYINTGKTTVNNGREVPILITVPKVGIVSMLSNITEAALDKRYGRTLDLEQREKMMTPGGIASAAVSHFTPPALKMPIEQATNFNMYTRQPIEPPNTADVQPRYRFDSRTSNTARVLSELMSDRVFRNPNKGISPARIEHALRAVFPASGEALRVTDRLLAATGKQPEIPRKDPSLIQKTQEWQPFVRAPSGFYSTEEAAARDEQARARMESRTPAFMYEQAVRRVIQDPSDAAMQAEADKWLSQIHNAQTIRGIWKRAIMEANGATMRPEDRAVMKAPRNLKARIGELFQR